jgi:hypothetical protein
MNQIHAFIPIPSKSINQYLDKPRGHFSFFDCTLLEQQKQQKRDFSLLSVRQIEYTIKRQPI